MYSEELLTGVALSGRVAASLAAPLAETEAESLLMSGSAPASLRDCSGSSSLPSSLARFEKKRAADGVRGMMMRMKPFLKGLFGVGCSACESVVFGLSVASRVFGPQQCTFQFAREGESLDPEGEGERNPSTYSPMPVRSTKEGHLPTKDR